MTTLKKRLLIAAAALAFLTAGAAIGNSASAASNDGRDYHISLDVAKVENKGEPPHHMKKHRPAPPPHVTKQYKENHKDQYKPEKKHEKKEKHDKKEVKPKKADWDKKHDGPRHRGPGGRHMPPPPPDRR